MAALSGWLPPLAAPVTEAAEPGPPAPGKVAVSEVAISIEGIDPRFATIVSIVVGAPLHAHENGTTATFLVPAAAEDHYRRLFRFVFSDGESEGNDPNCRPSAPGHGFDDELIVRVHSRVSPELVEVLAAVYRTRVLDSMDMLNAYLLARPRTLCMEDFKDLFLLSPLVSSVEGNAPVHAF